ncbi:hydroxymethylbilane synthase [Desulfosoma caldarium]|uniref:Porphobilinogen deaminase n=1 Tax=Desulfosoma caldarium TaxID=610254 RepID=A0A3N1V0C3_9BACT|nr:hydroxymethylbilane synthase [Desulfosoma caldarium]ROQ93581.1 hydroxymethylbilane synthase [Desulfosoma caldarium]
MKPHVVIGTRGSLLALRQANMIKEALEAQWPGLRVTLEIIKTTGDKILDVPLAKVGGKGLFVKEIEEALMDGRVDLAVHSMKDVPAVLPDPLTLAVVPPREDPRDVLVAHRASGLKDLPSGALIGTSSLRRAAQIRHLRPDLRVENLRGNLDTRLRKVREGLYDAVILAAAGLRRMDWQDAVTAVMDAQEFVPAIGQGALGIEVRKQDLAVRELVAPLHHEPTWRAVTAERAFLHELGGGCQVPIAGHAEVSDGTVTLTGLVASLDGKIVYRLTQSASFGQEELLGRGLARQLLEAGARSILESLMAQEFLEPQRPDC